MLKMHLWILFSVAWPGFVGEFLSLGEFSNSVQYTRPLIDGEDFFINELKGHTIHLYQIITYHNSRGDSQPNHVYVSNQIPYDVAQKCHLKRKCKVRYYAPRNDHLHTVQFTYFYVPDIGHPNYTSRSICNLKLINASNDHSGGFINSPNYPNGYPNNIACELHLTISEGQSLFLFLSDLQLEGRSKFRFWKKEPNDFLDLIDSKTKQLITRLSGEKRNSVIFLNPSNLTLRFHTDYANSWKKFRGFSLFYCAVPTRPNATIEQFTNVKEVKAAFKALFSAGNANESIIIHSPRLAYLHYLVACVAFLSAAAAVSSILVFCKNRRTMRYIRADVSEMINYLNSRELTGHNSGSVEMRVIKRSNIPFCENIYEYVEIPKSGSTLSEETKPELPTYEEIEQRKVEDEENPEPSKS
ncbi:hypothetical protein ACOME3_009063 [Neoechinorhynchus agilis]